MQRDNNSETRKLSFHMIIWTFVFTVAAAFPVMTYADEAWTSNVGLIEWESDEGSTAIFSLRAPGSENIVTRMYINELAKDVNGERGFYTGYWIDNSGENKCASTMIDSKGTKSKSWGPLEIGFEVKDGSHWKWKGWLGECFENRTTMIVAYPIKGGVKVTPENDPVKKLAASLALAFESRSLASLEKNHPKGSKIKVIITHSLAEEGSGNSIETSEHDGFEAAGNWFKNMEFQPGFPNREIGPFVGCEGNRCKYDIIAGLHNTLFLTGFTYGQEEGRYFIREIHITDGD